MSSIKVLISFSPSIPGLPPFEFWFDSLPRKGDKLAFRSASSELRDVKELLINNGAKKKKVERVFRELFEVEDIWLSAGCGIESIVLKRADIGEEGTEKYRKRVLPKIY